MTSWSQESYIKALLFAANAHNRQKVPGTELPYLTHLTMVSMEVTAALAVEDGLDGNLAIQCALLHDVLEDTDVAYDALKEIFGESVAKGVLALTKNDNLPKHEKMADSLTRIQQQPREVWMVKLADRISNLQPPPKHWTVEKMQSYQQEACQIYEALHTASPFLAIRLQQKIEGYIKYFA
jgi:(p)ppGpp synthase/HD superfamily hydrolase